MVWLYAGPNPATTHPSATATPTAANPASPAPTIGAATAVPTVIPVNTPTIVTVTSIIADPALIPTNVNLLRINSNSNPTILGRLLDNGTNGDAVAGDKIFTAQVNFTETTTGQIQLQISAAFRGVLRRVTTTFFMIDIWNQVTIPSNGFSFCYPTFGKEGRLTSYNTGEGALVVDVTFAAANNPPSSQYRLSFIPNPETLALTAWFAQKVDLSGSIMSAGIYSIMRLANGMEVLSVTGEIPKEHWDVNGPISDFYAISPSGLTVVVLATGQANQLDLLGVDDAAKQQAFLKMLSSMSLP
jgi:hypothetical protein